MAKKVKRFKQFTDKKADKVDANAPLPGAGVGAADAGDTDMNEAQLDELSGKDAIDKLGKHHAAMARIDKVKRGSAAQEYHIHQRSRAARLFHVQAGNVRRKHAVEFAAKDSKRAKQLKAQIKPTDYK